MTKKVSTTEKPLKADVEVSAKSSAKSVNNSSPEPVTTNQAQPIAPEAEPELVVEKIENEPVDLNKELSSRFHNKSRI